MKVSVIIPTFNRADMLCDCVQSVISSTYTDIEAIVADDCSSEDIRGALDKRFGNNSRIKYARTPYNGFTALARNCGARIADGEYMFFLDSDNILEPDAISEMVKCFVRHPKAAFVAPVTTQWSNGRCLGIWTLGSFYNPWTGQGDDRNKDRLSVPQYPPHIDEDFPTSYSPNAFMVTRAAFLAVNGFDSGYGMQFDEADFGLRVTKTAGEGYICGLALTRHLGYLDPDTTPLVRGYGIGFPKRAYCFGRNRVKFARRHFNFLQALLIALVFAPLSCVFYGRIALKEKRPDIAFAYLRGTIAGMLGLYRSKFYNA